MTWKINKLNKITQQNNWKNCKKSTVVLLPKYFSLLWAQLICSLVMFLAQNGRSHELSVTIMDWASRLIHHYATSLWARMQLIGQNSLSMFQAGPQFPRIMLSPSSCVSHPNFPNPHHHNLLPLLYSLVGGALMMTESSTHVWDPLIQGLRWLSGSIALLLTIKSFIRRGT